MSREFVPFFSTIFNGSLRPSPNHNICAFYKHIPIYSALKNRADRSINLLFTLELFKLKVTIQNGGRTGRKIRVKLACKQIFQTVLTSEESPMLLVRLCRTRRCLVLKIYWTRRKSLSVSRAGFSAEERMVAYGRFERTEIYC